MSTTSRPDCRSEKSCCIRSTRGLSWLCIPTSTRRASGADARSSKRSDAWRRAVDCVRDTDPRGVAYLGNVPVVRMDPDRRDRISAVIGRLLDEMFRTWMWLCRVGLRLMESPKVVFTARPPELIALAASSPHNGETVSTIVYPEPLLSADAERLFKEVAPGVRLQTLTDWLEERP